MIESVAAIVCRLSGISIRFPNLGVCDFDKRAPARVLEETKRAKAKAVVGTRLITLSFPFFLRSLLGH
jgi:hypothetical protein